MATISKNWATVAELHKTDAYGGTDADLAADQAYDYTSDVDLETSGHEGAQVFIEYKGNNQKDDLIVDVFGSLDGTSYDTKPYISKILANDGDWQRVSIIVKDLAHFRLGLKSSDTNTSFDYKITHQRWNLNNT